MDIHVPARCQRVVEVLQQIGHLADRRLEVTGPTNSQLPKPVATAGRSLLGLIDAAHSGAVTASAQSVPRRKGTTR